MNKASLVQQREPIQKLLGKDTNKGCAQAPELVLLDEFIEINAQEFKHQAEVLSVNKSILEAEKVMVVVFVELGVQLDGCKKYG